MDLIERYGEGGEIPNALTDYVKARKFYDYKDHSRVGAAHGEFVTDEICDRFCVLGDSAQATAKLKELESVGVDQFNIYLMTHGQEETLQAYGDEIIPGFAGVAASAGLLAQRPARGTDRAARGPLRRRRDGARLLEPLGDDAAVPHVERAAALLERLTDARRAGRRAVRPRQRARAARDGRRRATSARSSTCSTPGGEPRAARRTIRASSTRTPCFSRDGRLLAYSSNRRNGVDFDVVRARRSRAGRSGARTSLGGWCDAAGFSPDGRLLAVDRLTERAGDNDARARRRRDRRVVRGRAARRARPYVGPPAWLPDGRSFLFATSAGRDTAAIARYDVAARTWEVVLESRVGPRGARRRRGDAACSCTRTRTATRGSSCATRGRSSCATRCRCRAAASSSDTVFSRRRPLLAFQFTSLARAGRRLAATTRPRARRGADDEPERGRRARTLVEPELHRFESFDGESVPVFLFEPEGDGPVPVVIMDPRRPGGAAAAGLESRCHQYFVARGFAVAAPNVRGSTGYGKRYEHLDDVEKRLDSVRDLAALHDWLETRPGSTPRGPCSSAARTAATWCSPGSRSSRSAGPPAWTSSASRASSPSSRTPRPTGAPYREREYGSLERDRELLESSLADDARRRDPRAALHQSTARTTRACRSPSPSSSTACSSRAASRASCSSTRTRGTGSRSCEPARRLPARRRVPRGRAAAPVRPEPPHRAPRRVECLGTAPWPSG